MSNTIRKPRKRPRVRSSNFRTLFWLVRIEAQAMIEAGAASFPVHSFSRRRFLLVGAAHRARMVRDVLTRQPERSIYP